MQTCDTNQLGQTLQILQLIGSFILLMITAIYAVITNTIAKETRRGAEATRNAAQSSEEAAQASLRAAATAEAALKVTFEGGLLNLPNGDTTFDITPTSSNVWVHEMRLYPCFVNYSDDGSVERVHRQKEPVSLVLSDLVTDPLPILIHCDEARSFIWRNSSWTGEKVDLMAYIDVFYSFDQSSGIRKVGTKVESRPSLEQIMISFLTS